jgi:hypothetical protein
VIRVDPERWEIGSEFHWPGLPPLGEVAAVPWSPGLLVSSGRDALRLVLALGVQQRGWLRLWVPEYYCQHVMAALVRPGLELRTYPDHPLRHMPEVPDARPGDAILVMNYFGLRQTFAMPRRDGVEILEDHSHDPSSPWAASSAADFCVASLRKTIPLPDGGVLWSPLGHALPPEPHLTMQRTQAAATKLSAMILKGMYLEGHRIDKAWFRDLAQRGERGLAVPGVSSMSHVARATLDSFPVATWRSARAANHGVLSSLLAQVGWARVLAPADHDSVPLSCVVLVDSAQRREHARRHLIAANVFPAVLWPLEQTVMPVGHEARDLSRRMLSLHCDGRYGTADMLRIGEILAGMAGA